MLASDLLATLQARGARVQRLTGDRIGIQPASVLDDQLRACIRARKQEVLRLLRDSDTEGLDDAAIAESRGRLGAALLRSPRFGEVWVALDPCMRPTLAAEEARRPSPRPVLLAEDVVRLRGKPEEVVRAALETASVFPGVRVIQ